jgi:hypothetical protein
MSRIRSIHPGLWTDERFVSASPMARLFFMGIWNECDDLGSFEWSPLKLKMRILPADAADPKALLDELAEAGSVMRYEVDGKAYGAVRNFCQYQRPKKPNSVYPQTGEARSWVNIEARTTRDGSEPVPNELPTAPERPRQMKDGGGDKEDCSNEQSSAAPQADARSGKKMIPADWSPPPKSELPPRSKACAEQWTEASYQTEAEGFLLYWRGERKMKSDWRDTWANRIIARHSAVMRDQKFGNGAPEIPKYTAARSPEEAHEWWSGQVEFYRKINREDDALRCEAHVKALEVANPELADKVTNMIDRVTSGMRVSRARAA